MSQSGYTPIQLYRTTTAAAAPSAGNLAAGELAINLTDEKLYFKNAAGVVKLLASTDTLGTVTSVAVSGGTTGLTTSGGPITTSGTITLAGTLGVANGGTGTNTAFTAGSVVFAGASGVYSQDNANLFWDNTNDRLGIGTASPTYKLTVAAATGSATIGLVETSVRTWAMRAGGQATNTFDIADLTAGASRLLIDSSGNVGLGTASPAAKLDVIGNIRMPSTNSLYWAGGSELINAVENSRMTFFVASSERMRIDSSGNVGVGVVPSAWSAIRPVQTGLAASFSGGSAFNDAFIASNAYYDGTNWRYINTNTAYYNSIGGAAAARWYTAASGTAGNPITFTQAMAIDVNGNIAMGTGGAFSISGTKLSVTNPASSNTYVSIYGGAGSTNGGLLLGGNNAENFANIFWNTSSNLLQIAATPVSSSIKFDTAGSERMRIDGTGQVGIGISSPTAKLDVIGSAMRITNSTGYNASSAVRLDIGASNDTSVNNSATYQWSMNTAGDATGQSLIFSAYRRLDTTVERMRIDGSGNVGIGQTNPAAYGRLAIGSPSDTTNQTINILTRYATLAIIADATTAANGALIDTSWSSGGQGPLRFGFSGTERMRLTSAGDLFLNCTTGGVAVDGLRLTSTNVAQFSRTSADTLSCNRNGADGTIATWYKAGTAVGTISVTGSATAYNTSSDYRLKEIDGPIANSGAYIDALKPVQGSWKADGSRFIGLLAHEVQEVSETPIATGEKDGEEMQAMDYSAPELIANLIAEIQSLRARVAQLEGN